jgi:hypothetical protein
MAQYLSDLDRRHATKPATCSRSQLNLPAWLHMLMLQVAAGRDVKWNFLFVREATDAEANHRWQALLKGRTTESKANRTGRCLAKFDSAQAAAIASERALELLRFEPRKETIANCRVLGDKQLAGRVSSAATYSHHG